MLEEIWVREQSLGTGTFYIISGYGNYNGDVRFLKEANEGGLVLLDGDKFILGRNPDCRSVIP